MSAQRKSDLARKPIFGAGLFALGTAVLLGKLVVFFTATQTELMGAVPALGMALLRTSTTLPFAGHGRFSVVMGVLVSCWPLLLVAAGAALLIRSQVAKNRTSTAG